MGIAVEDTADSVQGDAIYISLADDAPPQAEGYSGRSYRIAQTWTPDGLRGKALWSWLLYGHVNTLDGEQRAIVSGQRGRLISQRIGQRIAGRQMSDGKSSRSKGTRGL